jgi:response regulator RpfG family c-di-GMP phosphodiesterase
MQRHPSIGAEVLRLCEAQVNGLGYSIFRMAIEIAEGHHERFDGTGCSYQRNSSKNIHNQITGLLTHLISN